MGEFFYNVFLCKFVVVFVYLGGLESLHFVFQISEDLKQNKWDLKSHNGNKPKHTKIWNLGHTINYVQNVINTKHES